MLCKSGIRGVQRRPKVHSKEGRVELSTTESPSGRGLVGTKSHTMYTSWIKIGQGYESSPVSADSQSVGRVTSYGQGWGHKPWSAGDVTRHGGDGHKAWAKTSVSPGVCKINWLKKFCGEMDNKGNAVTMSSEFKLQNSLII